MAKKKASAGGDEATVALKSLSDSMRTTAQHLGFKKRCALKTLQKTISTEQTWLKLSWIFTGVMTIATLVFFGVDRLAFGNYFYAGIFMFFWAACCFGFTARTQVRLRNAIKLEEEIKKNLGITD